MKLNRKAQGIGPFTFLFSIIFTLIILAFAGKEIFGLWTAETPTWISNLELFLINQVQFVFIFALILGVITYYYFGSRG